MTEKAYEVSLELFEGPLDLLLFLVKKNDLIRVRMINISPIELHPMHFHGHFTKEVAKDGTEIGGGREGKVENTVLIAPGQTIDIPALSPEAGERMSGVRHADISDEAHRLSYFAGLPPRMFILIAYKPSLAVMKSVL